MDAADWTPRPCRSKSAGTLVLELLSDEEETPSDSAAEEITVERSSQPREGLMIANPPPRGGWLEPANTRGV